MAFFNDGNSFQEIFILYKYHVCVDGGYRLFASEDDCLDDDDYNCLFRKIVAVSQPQNLNIRNFAEATKNLGDDRKFFYRCFGIYLREATLRYANGTTGADGRFWVPLEAGVNADFIRNRFGDKRWFWGNGTLRSGLQGELFRTIFRFFRDPELRCHDGEMAEHLMKLAVLPWNNNPLQRHLTSLISAYERNNLPSYINNLNLRGLNRSENTKRHLLFKIQDFMEFAEICVRENNDLQSAKQELKENFPYVRTSRHYFFSWLDDIYNNQSTHSQVRNIRHREKSDADRRLAARSASADAQIVCTIRDGEFCYKLPNRVHVADMFGMYFDDINNNDLVQIFESETSSEPLFQIRNKRFIADGNANEEKSVVRILMMKQIAIEFDDIRLTINNPWYKGENAFFFDELGRETTSWDGRTLYIVSFSKTVERVIDSKGVAVQFVQNNQNWVNVYSIPACANIESVDCLKIALSENSFVKIDADDPNAIHILANFIGRPLFVQQKFAQKIGVGSIEFSHLGDTLPATFIEQAKKAYADYAVTLKIDSESTGIPHLVIENNSDNVLELPRCSVGEKCIPAVTLLPQDTCVWVAKEKDEFVGYIKGNVQNLSPDWTWEEGLYKVHSTVNPISFSQGGEKYSLVNPDNSSCSFATYKHSILVCKNNNPFDICPRNANYLFKWRENVDIYEVCVPMEKTVRECYEKLGINGAELWFGWEFEGSRFVEHFEAEPNYTPTERDDDFYNMTKNDRQKYLAGCVTGEPFTSLDNQLFAKYPVVKIQKGKISYSWWLLHGVDYVVDSTKLPSNIRRAYKSGWQENKGEDYIYIYPSCLMDANITFEKAYELGKTFVYWKDQFSNMLLDYFDERPEPTNDSEANIAKIVDKHMIFSMEGVDIQNVAQLFVTGRTNEIDEMIKESVNSFVPKLIRYL